MVGGSLRVLWLLLPTKTGHHDIAEILLKVALKFIEPLGPSTFIKTHIKLYKRLLLYKIVLF
jgi:hypothetical protein